MRKRAALSEVISTMILAGVILAIGGMLWSYSLGAATVIADNYVDDTMSLLHEVTERFIIEYVSYYTDNDTALVWLYNYGDVDIELDIYLNATTTPSGYVYVSSLSNEVKIGEVEKIRVIIETSSGCQISVKAYSRRQNIAYKKYIVP